MHAIQNKNVNICDISQNCQVKCSALPVEFCKEKTNVFYLVSFTSGFISFLLLHFPT